MVTGKQLRVAALVWGLTLWSCTKPTDQEVLQNALREKDTKEQIAALKKFIEDYPQSKSTGRAYQIIFRNEVSRGDTAAALEAAAYYLLPIPENARMMDYNSMAWTLAENGMALDTALAFAGRAVNLARETGSRRLSMILDTYAYTLFKCGDAATAEKIQQEALAGNEEDGDFLSRLAEYQYANKKPQEALQNIVSAVLLGAETSYLKMYTSWLEREQPQQAARQILSRAIIEKATGDFLQNNGTPAARSRAAMVLALAGIDLDRAEKWALEAIQSLPSPASPDDQIQLHTNLAIVYKARNDTSKIIQILEPWQHLALPYDRDYWLNLALAYRYARQEDKSFQAVLNGLAMGRDEDLLALAAILGYNEREIESATAKFKQDLIAFNPGHAAASDMSTNRIVLTELFTGAECPPCVGADKALDLLAEYYPRQSMVLLEYHLHIPGPDPLTNSYAEARYEFYGRNFGTPTVFFNGVVQYTGGGPEIVKRSMFFRYRQAVNGLFTAKADMDLSLSAERNNNLIRIRAETKGSLTGHDTSLILHFALVEKNVNYTGANGISRHAYVVRYMLNEGKGIPFRIQEGTMIYEEDINLQEVDDRLKDYLDRFAQNPPERYKNFPGWNVRPDRLDRENLAVMAWIQDVSGKEIYQVACVDRF
jgi:hypothetical protein